jgi:hypothetical protein
MKEIVAELANGKLSGRPRAVERVELRAELSYETRAHEFAEVINAAIERRRPQRQREPQPG